MEYICGMTFAPFVPGDHLCSKESKESFLKMKENTHADFVTFVPNALQDTPQSETITVGRESVTKEQLTEMILFAKEQGMKVAIKPTVNCKNGTWRAHINFFDEDVPCEPKWGNWFRSYTEFQAGFAKIAEEAKVDLFIPGCEMVMSEHREEEWRKLISDLRDVYKGPITYNTDKYQEHNVKWWDALDYISSSGYYPIDKWDTELDRIEKVVKKFDKPFIFAETGCMSVRGSNMVPNNWAIRDECDLKGQADWYDTMFKACEKRDWIKGMFIWAWCHKLYNPKDADKQLNYDVYSKPAEEVIRNFYDKKRLL